MAAEVEDCISEGFCNTTKYGLVPICPFNVLSTGLGDEIGLDLKLMEVNPYFLLRKAVSYPEANSAYG